MKIINIRLDDTQLVVELDDISDLNAVYLDTIDNKQNMFASASESHSFSFLKAELQIVSNSFIIELNALKTPVNSLIVSITDSNGIINTKFVINEQTLYLAKINLLESYCSTCLDKHQKENILLCQFKSNLLDYALQNDLTEDAISYYIDLARMLRINDSHVCGNHVCNNKNNCKTCCNGCCAL